MNDHVRFSTRAAALAIAGLVALLAGCTHGRIQRYADEVQTRYIGAPATLAVNELGTPTQERPVADLRSYIWETGKAGELGGNCRLILMADPTGKVVDYRIDGTPLGCERVLKMPPSGA